MIKFILRKPLFPILLLILVVFEVLFMGILRRGIERDIQTVEDMYDNAVVTFEALPSSDGGGVLLLRPHFGDDLERMEEVEKVFRTMSCHYSLREPETVVDNGWLYGTNDALWFGESQELTFLWAENKEPEGDKIGDWTDNDGDIPCIVDEALLKEKDLALGDHLIVAPYDGQGVDSENAPSVNLYIIGCFENETEKLERFSIIVPDCIFLTAPTILYNWRMLDSNCAYRQFKMQIKKEYNRSVEEVEEKMLETLTRANVLMHSDVRILKKAVRPVEQRLKIQKALEGPLEIAMSVATALMAMLMAIGVQDDIFLFLLWGEPRVKTYVKTLFNLAMIVFGAAFVAFVSAFCVLGFAWIGWILKYLLANVLLCIFAASIPTFVFCNRNLVYFYQTKEV